MRLITTLLLSCLCGAAIAAEKTRPPNLEPLEPPPSLDANAQQDADQEPQVTIIQHTEQTVEEYRVAGRLYMIKIIPKTGKPYYLVDDRGDGKFSRQESLDSGVRPPRWIIHEF